MKKIKGKEKAIFRQDDRSAGCGFFLFQERKVKNVTALFIRLGAVSGEKSTELCRQEYTRRDGCT